MTHSVQADQLTIRVYDMQQHISKSDLECVLCQWDPFHFKCP